MLFVNNKKKAVVFFVFSNMDNNLAFKSTPRQGYENNN
jgi:hypothetical protein